MNHELEIALYLTDDATEIQVALFYLWHHSTLTPPEPLENIEDQR